MNGGALCLLGSTVARPEDPGKSDFATDDVSYL